MTIATFATVLEPTTDAGNSSGFQATKEDQTISIQVVGLAGAEKAYLEMWDGIAEDWVEFLINGVQPYCDAGNNVIYVGGCERYRIDKDASVAEVGVFIKSFANISIDE